MLFCGICLAVGFFSFRYYAQLQETIREESSGYLQEISRRVGNNISRIIGDNYIALSTTAATLEEKKPQSFADLASIANLQKNAWSYQHMLFIDEAGKAYDTNGKSVPLNNRSYFQSEEIAAGYEGISTTQMIDNQECILFTVPMAVNLKDKRMVALGASYSPEVFSQTLSMKSFSGQAYSCIISTEGTYVVRPTQETALQAGYNVITSIGQTKLKAGNSVEKLKEDIKQGVAGQISFEANDGQSYYMVYTPIETEDWYLLTYVPVDVVNEKSDMLLRTTLLLCGLITLVFAGLIAFLVYTFHKNKQKLEQIAYIDDVTGGNTIQRFYELAETSLETPGHPQYILIYSNIEKFKVLNEQFGRRVGDQVLKICYQTISSHLKSGEQIGRLSADNFCILIELDQEANLVKRFRQWFDDADTYLKDSKQAWVLPTTEFGVFIIDNDTIPFTLMIDRAKLALRESVRIVNGKLKYAIYDDEVRRRIFREKLLEDMMEDSLNKGEFQLYLQPKYRTADSTIGGAEALARWKSASEGMIFPDEFIPLFEKNGFVIQLDLFIFKEACRYLRKWMDAGLEPIPISVNCSRVHLKSSNFLDAYVKIAQEFNIPPKLLEIELTESVVMEDSGRLTKVIDEIHREGFTCSMDDFGSGYSSLNLIQSIAVDTLKLDKIFFRKLDQDPERMRSVVGSIVNMAQALTMVTVAEGVEYPEQVEMLREIGCDYIQGYVFAKPMEVPSFEQLAFGEENL